MRRATAFWGGALLLGSAVLAQPTSSEQNPVHTFSTPGQHQVTLQACNQGGCDTEIRTVTVLNPMPAIVSAVVGVAAAEAGQLVSLSGSGIGKPPLSYTWRVLLGASLVREVSGALGWLDTAGLAPGGYSVLLRLSNAAGQVESVPTTLTITPAQPADFYTVLPCRLLDTRNGTALQSGVTRLLNVSGACGIPGNARAISVNVTVVSPTALGNVVFFPGNYPSPVTSTIHYLAAATRSNNAILPLSTDGTATLAALATVQNSGTVHLLLDVNGYFAVP
jgi:PKD repeat protein